MKLQMFGWENILSTSWWRKYFLISKPSIVVYLFVILIQFPSTLIVFQFSTTPNSIVPLSINISLFCCFFFLWVMEESKNMCLVVLRHGWLGILIKSKVQYQQAKWHWFLVKHIALKCVLMHNIWQAIILGIYLFSISQ